MNKSYKNITIVLIVLYTNSKNDTQKAQKYVLQSDTCRHRKKTQHILKQYQHVIVQRVRCAK